MLIYLASPYTSRIEAVRQKRHVTACTVAAHLIHAGYNVFSPIAHTHAIQEYGGLPVASRFYERLNEEWLRRCDELYVITMPGWDVSAGVEREIHYMHALMVPIRLIDPDTFAVTEYER